MLLNQNKYINTLLIAVLFILTSCQETKPVESLSTPGTVENLKKLEPDIPINTKHSINENIVLEQALKIYTKFNHWEDVLKLVILAYDVESSYVGIQDSVIDAFITCEKLDINTKIFNKYKNINYTDWLKYKKQYTHNFKINDSPTRINILTLVGYLKSILHESYIGEASEKTYSNYTLLIDLLTLKPVMADSFCNIYNKNEIRGDYLYKEKTIILIGYVNTVRKNDEGIVITLNCPNSLFDIDITLATNQKIPAHVINENEKITIKGIVKGKSIFRYSVKEGFILKIK